MSKKIVAVTLSTTMMLNPLQMAFAQTTESSDPMMQKAIAQMAQNPDVKKAIEEMMMKASSKVTPENIAQAKMALAEVLKLKGQLNGILNSNEKDLFLQWADFMQVVLAATTTITGQMHATSQEKANITLAITATTAMLSSAVRHYKLRNNLNPNQMADILRDTMSEIKKDKIVTDELAAVSRSLGEVGSSLLENQDVLAKAVEQLGGGSDWVAYATVVYCIMNILMPRVAAETNVVLSSVLPQVKKLTGKTTGGASIPDLAGVSMGLGSETSQKMIKATLFKVDSSIVKLQQDIQALEARSAAQK